MIRRVALARGVNVGGAKKLPMKALREIFARAGAERVATILQSGNVIFDIEEARAAGLLGVVRADIAREFGFDAPWIARSSEGWRELMAGNPYIADGDEPNILHVAVLSTRPDPGLVAALDAARSPGDSFAVVGGAIYLRLPNGVARTRLTNVWFDKSLGVVSTYRNWATAMKIAAALAAGDGA